LGMGHSPQPPTPNPQSPIPNPQSPIPKGKILKRFLFNNLKI